MHFAIPYQIYDLWQASQYNDSVFCSSQRPDHRIVLLFNWHLFDTTLQAELPCQFGSLVKHTQKKQSRTQCQCVLEKSKLKYRLHEILSGTVNISQENKKVRQEKIMMNIIKINFISIIDSIHSIHIDIHLQLIRFAHKTKKLKLPTRIMFFLMTSR